MTYKAKMQKEGAGEGKVPLHLWLKSTRRFLENTTADDTNVVLWSIMELPAGTVLTDPQSRRNLAAKDALLTHLSTIMGALVEGKILAADMWRVLVQVRLCCVHMCPRAGMTVDTRYTVEDHPMTVDTRWDGRSCATPSASLGLRAGKV